MDNSIVRKYHPDHNPNNIEAATKKTQKVNEAYRVLNNPVLRAEYDAVRVKPPKTDIATPDPASFEPSASSAEMNTPFSAKSSGHQPSTKPYPWPETLKKPSEAFQLKMPKSTAQRAASGTHGRKFEPAFGPRYSKAGATNSGRGRSGMTREKVEKFMQGKQKPPIFEC